MTPLPKKKSTKARSAARKVALKLDQGGLTKCSSCGKLRQPHRACRFCGKYK